jgi:hypothetical protein
MESAIFAPWPISLQQPPGSGTDDQGLTGSQDLEDIVKVTLSVLD